MRPSTCPPTCLALPAQPRARIIRAMEKQAQAILAAAAASPVQSAAMVANCVAYSADGKRIGDISLDAISDVLERPDTFVWVGLIEPDEALLEKLQ